MLNMTDNFLETKAALANQFVLETSKIIVREISLRLKEKRGLSKDIEIDLDSLPREKRAKIVFIVAYALLFNAQRFYWENIINDEERGRKFEIYLYEEFAKLGADPIPHINDYLDYIKKIGDSGEIQYVGRKICEELSQESAWLMIDISVIYASFLTNGFYQGLRRIWDTKY